MIIKRLPEVQAIQSEARSFSEVTRYTLLVTLLQLASMGCGKQQSHMELFLLSLLSMTAHRLRTQLLQKLRVILNYCSFLQMEDSFWPDVSDTETAFL